MKLVIPHIHKTLGDAGFWAEISKRGEIKELRVKILEGLRQIEGILIGRRVFETPLIISRVCGICPTSHILNACSALEKVLEIKPSLQTERLRKLMTAAQIIQSHSLHIFFMSLADFFDMGKETDLTKKFPKETEAVLRLRDFALKIIEIVGGRTVHPMTPIVGGFSKIPEKSDYKKILKEYPAAFKSALVLIKLFQKLNYPALQRKTVFCSLYSKKDYPYHKGQSIKIGARFLSLGDFFSNQIEEDLKEQPAKRVKFQGRPYMLGAIARIKNNGNNLDPEAKEIFEELQRKHPDFFENTFYNTFCQAVEILHFIKEIKKLATFLLENPLEEPCRKYKISKGSGLGVLEAPRGTLFSYFEVDRQGRISDCRIITPTAQFLRNLEEDLRVLLTDASISKDKKIKKVKILIRAYDPCIACAVH